MAIMEVYAVGRWCNGNTPDSGSGYWGSSPCLPAKSLPFNLLDALRKPQEHGHRRRPDTVGERSAVLTEAQLFVEADGGIVLPDAEADAGEAGAAVGK